MTIKFHSAARIEFFEIAEYYEEQVVGLGDEFVDEIEKVLDLLERYPLSGTKITDREQRVLASRFPFGIIYSVQDDLIQYLQLWT